MSELVEKITAGEYLEVNNPFFSVGTYERFTAAAQAQEIIVGGSTKLVTVRHLISGAPELTHPNYVEPNFEAIPINGETVFVTEIPLDSFFLGGVDLSDSGLPADKSEYMWQIRDIVVSLRQQGVKQWESDNNITFPMAFSPSTQSIYGFVRR